jgi:hypothetical protein
MAACSSTPPPSVTDAGPDAGGDQCNVDSDCPSGLICDLSSGTGLCRLPYEFEACQPDAGCASSSAVCTAVPLLGEACAVSCQTTADCPDPITSCRNPPGSTALLLCLPTPCADGGLYAPCPVEPAADGLCIPGGLFGTVCLAGGTVPLDGGCSLARTSAGSASGCVPGDVCSDSDGGAICFPLCGSAGDAGLGCAGGTSCVSFTGGPVAAFATYGYCAETCDPEASGSCPTGLSCVDYVSPPVCWP